jgi:hypothetical protein
VIPGLEEVNAVVTNEIHDPVLGREPPAPDVGAEMLERLRLADSLERIAHHGLDDLERAPGGPWLGFDPPAEVFTELTLED